MRRPGILLALGLAAAIAAVYARALPAPFVFDDQFAIVGNETIHSLTPLGRVLQQPPDLPTSGRPIVALSLALNYAAGGLDPRGYRLVNGLLHWLAALLVFGVVRGTLESPRCAPRFAAHARGVGVAVALLFAAHPLASEVVCYVTARTESLMAVFYLATLWCVSRAHGSAQPWGWAAAAVASCAAGMGCKEAMASAPLVTALHDGVFWGRAQGVARRVRFATWSGLALTWIVLLHLALQAPRAESAGLGHWVSPAIYLANQCRLVPHYLRLVVAPWPLVLDYGTPDPIALADVGPGFALLASLLGLSLYALWRWPAAGFVGIACFAILAPSSSVVPVVSEVGAERRMYLPLAALLALAVTLTRPLIAPRRPRWLAAALVGLAALVLGAVSFARAGDYRSAIALWRADVAAQPLNRRAHYNLSKAYQAEGRTAEAQAERAVSLQGEIEYYERVLPLQRDPVRARVDLGALHELAGHLPRARDQYLDALARAPDDPYALRRMARLLLRGASDPGVLAEARRYAERAVAVTGRRDAAALETLAEVQLASQQRAAAIATLQEALRTDPRQQEPDVLERIRDRLALEGSPSPG